MGKSAKLYKNCILDKPNGAVGKSTVGVVSKYSRAKKRRSSRSSRILRSAKTYGFYSEMENKEIENAIYTLDKMRLY